MNTTLSRFMSKVSKKGKCWIWVGVKNSKGYGYFSYNGKLIGAHIVSYIMHKKLKERPTGEVCHTCDNPSCVNPKHLWLGTRLTNSLDASAKGRLKGGPGFPGGQHHPNSKLTSSDVSEIRKLRKSGMLLSEIAKMFNVTPSCVCNISKLRSRKTG